jgi:glycerophosphoryl diester phosphodiesterase
LLDDAALVAQTVSAGHRALHPHHSLVTDSLVDLAHRNDLAVNVWTVDEPERIRQLAQLGVDCIITNVPDLARRVIEGLA